MLIVERLNYNCGGKLNINEKYFVLDTDDMTLEVESGFDIVSLSSSGVAFANYSGGRIKPAFLSGKIINLHGVSLFFEGKGVLHLYCNGVYHRVGMWSQILAVCGIKPRLGGFKICGGNFELDVDYENGVLGYEHWEIPYEEYLRRCAVKKVIG